LKAHKDLQAYDGIEPNSNGNNDSTSIPCWLLNALFCNACLSRFQMLGSKKTMAELDKGGAGQDKEFWEFVAVEFNDYENNQYGSLLAHLLMIRNRLRRKMSITKVMEDLILTTFMFASSNMMPIHWKL
jgi:hypothetical protein